MAQMGRPRSFDREEAIHQAMHLFWEHGYDATSLTQLKAGIGGGITAPSFYAAFGSKEGLFKEVVTHYLATHGQVESSLWDERLPPREAVELTLRRSAKMQSERGHPKGCLMVVSAAGCSGEHLQVQKMLAQARTRTRDGIASCVERAKASGELPSETDARALSMVFGGFLVGLTTLARDGMTSVALNNAVTEIMQVWDAGVHKAKAH
ncbi:TetR/AcrR family transcriptional regulator [Comamonas sp. JUb58]|uniref:TetR/AcrR family transcriptional regulator n=1 Tax=Comamonas sp. JUb58 TaxID=2485114 RepID=UPI00105E7764|nr:TetR/AcrR family transcriptional regulator [Comamonas sp. JUb58]TDS84954.1 TetR family transcriptional regulator [Comamonas sp. JUb58]